MTNFVGLRLQKKRSCTAKAISILNPTNFGCTKVLQEAVSLPLGKLSKRLSDLCAIHDTLPGDVKRYIRSHEVEKRTGFVVLTALLMIAVAITDLGSFFTLKSAGCLRDPARLTVARIDVS